MKQSRLISVVIATILMLCSADAFAQRSRGGGSGSSGGRMEGGPRPVYKVSSSSQSSSGSSSGSSSRSSYSSGYSKGSCCGGQVRSGGYFYNDAFRNRDYNYNSFSMNNSYYGSPSTIGYGLADDNDHVFTCSLFDVFSKKNMLIAPYPIFGYEVSKRTATKESILISRPSGDFYYRDGIFFSQSPKNSRKYVIHKPCCGFRVPNIPSSRREYVVNDISYYYFYGTFYIYDDSTSEYVVVAPPAGLVLNKLPRGARVVEVGDNRYYIVGNVLYKALCSEEKCKFEVAKLDRKEMRLVRDFLASSK